VVGQAKNAGKGNTTMKRVREKKHRLPREKYCGRAVVSFTACLVDRRKPFFEEAIVREFTTLLGEAALRFQCRVLIFCFMPDHLHFLLEGVTDSADSWAAAVLFKQKTGFWFGQQRPEFSWQKDFHDHVIRANEDLVAHARYIAHNPVRWGFVKEWHEYRFTGAFGVDLHDIMADAATM
jgi:REP element-mobilizing transposase RayT